MRDAMGGMTPDHMGTGARGDPNKYALDRVARHLYQSHSDGDEPLILEEQRARQAKETADKLALENKLTRQELIEPEVAAAQSEKFARQLVAFLAALPASLVRMLPHLESNDHARIRRAIIAEQNKLASELAEYYGSGANADRDNDPGGARSAA